MNCCFTFSESRIIYFDKPPESLNVGGGKQKALKRRQLQDEIILTDEQEAEPSLKPLRVETVNQASELPTSGVHYLSLENTAFSSEQQKQLVGLHNHPLIKKWLDEIGQFEELFLITDFPYHFQLLAWNDDDIKAPINISTIRYDAPIQKFLRGKYPKGQDIPGVMYSCKSTGVTLATVANEIFERYIRVKLKRKFGDKFGPFQDYVAVQIPNTAIDTLFLGQDPREYNWQALAKGLNRYSSFSVHPGYRAYVEWDDYILPGDENATLRSHPELQAEIAELLIKKIADITEQDFQAVPLKIEYRDVTVALHEGVTETVFMPFFVLK